MKASSWGSFLDIDGEAKLLVLVFKVPSAHADARLRQRWYTQEDLNL